MANEDDKVLLELDLDDSKFISKLVNAQKSLKDLGDKKNLDPLNKSLTQTKDKVDDLTDVSGVKSLVNSVMSLAPALGVVTAAGFAAKKALDMTLEAEQILAVEANFRTLAATAGLSAEHLEEGLKKSAQGLVDTSDLLAVANKGIIAMGESAAKLPEVMDLARRATSAFGGSVSENFEKLTTAVSTGNVRLLRQFGIVVDVERAMRNYAKTMGTTIDTITEAGRRQAILDDVLKKGNESFKETDPTIKSVTNSWTKLGVSVHNFYETFILWFRESVGPRFAKDFEQMRAAVESLTNWFQEKFPTGATKAKQDIAALDAQIVLLEKQIAETKGKLEGTEKRSFWDYVLTQTDKDLQDRLTRLDAQLAAMVAKKEEAEAKLKKPAEPDQAPGAPAVNAETKLAQEARVNQELLAMRQARITQEIAMATQVSQVEELFNQQKLNIERQYNAQLAAWAAERAQEKITGAQYDELATEAAMTRKQREADLELRLVDAKIRAYENYQRAATSVQDGIARAAQASAAKQKAFISNTSRVGQDMYNRFEQTAVDAFVAIGEGAATGQNLIKKVVLGSIADMAISYGRTMAVTNAFPPVGPNPGAAAGVGLMVFGGYLKGMAGGSSKVEAGGGDTSGGKMKDFDSKLPDMKMPEDRPMVEEAKPQRAVTIQIQGNFYETEETRTRLLEMIRQSTDATDFKYQQIGGR